MDKISGTSGRVVFTEEETSLIRDGYCLLEEAYQSLGDSNDRSNGISYNERQSFDEFLKRFYSIVYTASCPFLEFKRKGVNA